MDQGTTAAPYLPDELVVEILVRLPAKLLCRFKCVSRRWRRLISDPAHRARLAQTLSGFFFVSSNPGWRFIGLPSSVTPLRGDGGQPLVDATLSFLPPICRERKTEILDSCNGLLLLLCSDQHPSRPSPPFYIVCNPATREWVALPQPKYTEYREGMRVWYAAVGFDPAISLHFYVFQVVEENDGMQVFVVAVEVYSSETGTWDIRECKRAWLNFLGRMTYFNGFMHLPVEYESVVSLDTKGKAWQLTQVQPLEHHCYGLGRGYVGLSQGWLVYANNDPKDDILSVYILEGQDGAEWTLKHSVSKRDLLFEPWKRLVRPTYYIAGFHPDGDLIFFYDRTQNTLISYNMNRSDWQVVCALEDFEHAHHPFFPYVPWYSRGLASPNSASNSPLQG
ncbi:unnamed protein product [Urochloa decumbens]|uniref:F-box domain-containing protein n=1 Tax=Urochloa decumbens TaxID=240449 RepID=A0ABC9FQQ4_9POAL